MFVIFTVVLAAIFPAAQAEDRAMAYLAREVPRWFSENGCFSGHNNGDAARALYIARQTGIAVPNEALADTHQWISRPVEWDEIKREAGFSSKSLARIQFGEALLEAISARAVTDRDLLIEAADRLLSYQQDNGSWQIDLPAEGGSPVTDGFVLATYMARRVLSADAGRFRSAIDRADRWLTDQEPSIMMDAATLILALHDRVSSEAERRVEASLRLLLDGQSSDGGWGPYPHSPAEVFDTAISILALHTRRGRPNVNAAIEREGVVS